MPCNFFHRLHISHLLQSLTCHKGRRQCLYTLNIRFAQRIPAKLSNWSQYGEADRKKENNKISGGPKGTLGYGRILVPSSKYYVRIIYAERVRETRALESHARD